MQPITKRARILRKNQTPAEEALWRRVRNRQLGWKIVRQKPVILQYYGKTWAFVADFYCHEVNLVIEVDGGIHSRQSDYDSIRAMLMNQKGLRLIRFTNDEVLTAMEDVIRRLKEALSASSTIICNDPPKDVDGCLPEEE